MSKLLRSFARLGDESCWRSPRLATKVKTALASMFFVLWGIGQTNAQVLCEPDYTCPEDITVECGTDLDDLTILGGVEIVLDECLYIVTYFDAFVSSDGCETVWSRTFTILVVGGDSWTCTQTITVADTTGPVFVDFEPNLSYQCEEDVPPISFPDAIDECGEVAEIDTLVVNTGADTLNCVLTLAVGPGLDWSLWLNGLAAQGLATNDYYRWVPGTAFMSMYDDGTAHLYGEVVNVLNPNEGWYAHFYMNNGMHWADWSALGRSYKDDLGLGAPYHTFWTYYELVGGFSSLDGLGDNLGSNLTMTHMPSNYYFGFQCGQGANNRNANMGLSGWFYYGGTVVYNGESTDVTGHGDVTTDKECTPNNPNVACLNEFTYIFRALDDCGNETVVTQTISVQDTIVPEFVNCPESFSIECDQEIPGPIAVEDLIVTDNCDDSVTVTLIDAGTLTVVDACHSYITYLYQAEDDCANRNYCTYTIDIYDTTAPMLSVPASFTAECDDEIMWEDATATDNCQENVIITVTDTDTITEGCVTTITRWFTADDGCGNIATGSQTVTIVDTTAPVFNDFPLELWVECEMSDSLDIPTATDNCDEEVEVTYTYEVGSGGCLGVWVVTYTATDDCGNTATATQYIHIQDTTPPTIEAPDDMTVECDSVPAPWEIEIYDNCGMDVDVSFTTETIDGECEYTILWIWVAMDFCENVSTDTTVITVVDTTAPVIDVAEGGVYACDEEVIIDGGSASDNCDPEVDLTVTYDTIPGECPQEWTIVVNYVAVDNCGNTATASATYSVVDDEAPVFGDNQSEFQYECDQDAEVVQPTATDNCGEVSYTFMDTLMVETVCYESFWRVWTATDECGNWSQFWQFIYFLDTTAPVITGEEQISIPCEEFDMEEGIYVEATDNCNEVTIVVDSTQQVSGECAGVYIRYYTAYDLCQNVSEQFIQIIFVTDTTAPVGVEPEDISVLCSDDIPSFDPMFTDNCGALVTVVYTGFEVTNECDSSYVETWVGTDNCGNSTTIDRVVTIYDNVNPVFDSFPEDATVNCDDMLPEVMWPTASDNCDEEVEIEYTVDSVPGDCPQEWTYFRTFRGFDNCGNQVQQTQTITVVDNEAPVFGDNQSEFQYECDEDAEVVQPTATDNCGEVTYTFMDTSFFAVECYESFWRVWTATDDCGNSSQFWQFIYFLDTTAPVITGEPEVTVLCEDFDLNEGIYVEATDNCNTVTIVIDSTLQVSGLCSGTYIRYYTAYDLCGNASEQFMQIIHVIDETAPVVVEDLVDASYECDEFWFYGIPVFEDNCDEELTIEMDVATENDGCTWIYTYTWTATDNCDNSVTVDQVITVTDTTAPVASFDPEDFTIECGQFWDVVVPVFSDNCDDSLTYDSDVTEVSDSCSTYITFWWSATDNCGNVTVVGNTVTITDTVAPLLEVPMGNEYSCDEEIDFGMAAATDVCDEEVSITWTDAMIPGECPQAYSIIRTWTATDDCGNSSSASTTYWVYDNEAPEFTSVPDAISIECDEAVPASEATATDNCGEVTITWSDSELLSDSCAGYYIRTFIATDECGNWSSASQVIDLIDTTAPELIMPNDTDAEIPCQEVFYAWYLIWAAGEATEEQLAAAQALFAQYGLLPVDVIDNCDTTAYWQEVGINVIVDSLECPVVAVLECTFQAFDNCGNASETASSYIYVIDETAPVLVNPIEDEFIECDQEPSGWQPIFDDECNDDITVEAASSIMTDGCTTMIHQTWIASDPCGNSVTVVHNITITDTTPPSIIVPENVTVNCDDEFGWGEASIWDNCDEELDITMTDDTIEGNCPQSYTIVRTWVAVDNCLNTTTASASITVVDNEAPVFSGDNQFEFQYECDEDAEVVQPTATDNCGEVTYTFMDTSFVDVDCYQSFWRVWTATDECGNWSNFWQFIYFLDTTAPVITGEEQVEVTCEEFSINEGIFVEATDNCNEVTIVIDSTQQVSGECAGVYIRYYTAYDLCQNASAQFVQIIFVTDETAPVGTEPEDVTISCDEEAPFFDPEFTDNCGALVVVVYEGYEVTDICDASYTETWTGYDNCGNFTVIDRVVTITDEVAPVFNEESFETTVPCNVIVDYVYPTAWDNCDDTVVVTLDFSSVAGECPGEYTETHLWTATDDCGNTSTITYITHHVDEIAPVLEGVPTGGQFECDDLWLVIFPTATDNCSLANVITEIDTIAGECVNNYTVVYSFYAVDQCGNQSETVTASYFIYDDTAPTFDNEVSDESYECLNWDEYVVQSVTASDNCGTAEVTYTINEGEVDECGNGTWTVVYTATDLCGLTSVQWYTISVEDTTAPVLSETPADLVLDCTDDIPAAPDVTASDNCDEIVEVIYTETCLGDCPEEGEEDCDLVQPDLGENNCNYPVAWSMALFALPDNNHRYYYLDESWAGNEFTIGDDGTIHVVSRVISWYDPNGGFDIDVTFGDMATWEEWNNDMLPSGFKSDCGGEASNHEDWLFYLLQAGDGAEVIGWGSYAGSALNVVHAPANNYFGFQYGDGANNLSSGHGLGGWFTYSGTFLYNGEPISSGSTVSGAGDFAWELDCCPDYSVVRCWTAIDCSGNETTWCQTITFEDLDEVVDEPVMTEPQAQRGGIEIVSVLPNPATEKSVIAFTSEMEGKLSLQVLDAMGRVVGDLFNNQVEAGQIYRADFNVVSLEAGLYMIRLTNGTDQKLERIIVSR